MVKISDNYVKCTHKDEVVEFTSHSSKKNHNVYFGNIVCPSCEELCKDQIKCPSEHAPQLSRSSELSKEQRQQSDLRESASRLAERADSEESVLIVSNRNRPNWQGGTSPNKNLHSVYLHNQHEFCLKHAKTVRSSGHSLFVSKFCSLFIYFCLFIGRNNV
jgi:hypothetical protein